MLFFFIAIPDKKWRKIPQLQLHQSTRVPPGWLHECVAHLQWRRFSGQEEAAVLQPGLPGELEAMSQLVTDDLPCYSLPKKTIYYCMYIYILCIYIYTVCIYIMVMLNGYVIAIFHLCSITRGQLVGWISKDTNAPASGMRCSLHCPPWHTCRCFRSNLKAEKNRDSQWMNILNILGSIYYSNT